MISKLNAAPIVRRSLLNPSAVLQDNRHFFTRLHRASDIFPRVARVRTIHAAFLSPRVHVLCSSPLCLSLSPLSTLTVHLCFTSISSLSILKRPPFFPLSDCGGPFHGVAGGSGIVSRYPRIPRPLAARNKGPTMGPDEISTVSSPVSQFSHPFFFVFHVFVFSTLPPPHRAPPSVVLSIILPFFRADPATAKVERSPKRSRRLEVDAPRLDNAGAGGLRRGTDRNERVYMGSTRSSRIGDLYRVVLCAGNSVLYSVESGAR